MQGEKSTEMLVGIYPKINCVWKCFSCSALFLLDLAASCDKSSYSFLLEIGLICFEAKEAPSFQVVIEIKEELEVVTILS